MIDTENESEVIEPIKSTEKQSRHLIVTVYSVFLVDVQFNSLVGGDLISHIFDRDQVSS